MADPSGELSFMKLVAEYFPKDPEQALEASRGRRHSRHVPPLDRSAERVLEALLRGQ